MSQHDLHGSTNNKVNLLLLPVPMIRLYVPLTVLISTIRTTSSFTGNTAITLPNLPMTSDNIFVGNYHQITKFEISRNLIPLFSP